MSTLTAECPGHQSVTASQPGKPSLPGQGPGATAGTKQTHGTALRSQRPISYNVTRQGDKPQPGAQVAPERRPQPHTPPPHSPCPHPLGFAETAWDRQQTRVRGHGCGHSHRHLAARRDYGLAARDSKPRRTYDRCGLPRRQDLLQPGTWCGCLYVPRRPGVKGLPEQGAALQRTSKFSPGHTNPSTACGQATRGAGPLLSTAAIPRAENQAWPSTKAEVIKSPKSHTDHDFQPQMHRTGHLCTLSLPNQAARGACRPQLAAGVPSDWRSENVHTWGLPGRPVPSCSVPQTQTHLSPPGVSQADATPPRCVSHSTR